MTSTILFILLVISCAIGIISNISWHRFCNEMNDDWSKICSRMNDGWYETCSALNDKLKKYTENKTDGESDAED